MPVLPDQIGTLAVFAGAGEYPRLVLEGARRAGVRVVCLALKGSAPKGLEELCELCVRFRIGAVERIRDFLCAQKVTHLMMAGQIRPSSIYTLWPDAMARRLLAGLDRRNAHTIFGTICTELARIGITVLPATTFMEERVPGEGHLAGPAPTEAQLREADAGLVLAREIARLDIGQSVVVQGERLTCVEAFKGTNECLQSGGHRGAPVTLCKVTKPGHDMRFDVPCIGLSTIRNCLDAGVNHIAIEADRTIIFQRDEVLRLCRDHGITLHARRVPSGGPTLREPGHMASDLEHARFIAEQIERLGIGHSAIVCDGVVIAVEDPDGPEKCLARAGAYMKRLRFARLLNWLGNLLLGRRCAPPAPMVMGGTDALHLTPELRRCARRAGVQLPQ